MSQMIGYDCSRFCSRCSSINEQPTFTCQKITKEGDSHHYICPICEVRNEHPFKIPAGLVRVSNPPSKLSQVNV